MKLVLDARYLKTTGTEVVRRGGVDRYTYEIATRLIELDSDIRLTLFVPPGNKRPIIEGAAGRRVREIRVASAPHSLSTLLRLARHVPLDADLFHSPFNVLPRGLPCAAVTTVHDVMWLQDPRYISSFALKRLVTGTYYRVGIFQALRLSDRILTVSEATKRAITAIRPELSGRIRVTPNGADPFFHPIDRAEAETATERLVPRGTRFVLVVGNLSPHKNHLRAIEAFLRAYANDPTVRLVVVRRFRRLDFGMSTLARRADVRERVIFLPVVSDIELRALYNRALVLLFPSLAEGFGIPPLEAMACRTPVVTSNVSSLPEVVGDAAVQVDPRSVEAIAAGLERLRTDEALRRILVERGVARARGFTWDACARGTLACYQELLASPSRRRAD